MTLYTISRYMGYICDFVSVRPNQGLTIRILLFHYFPLVWTCFDTQNFKRLTNCFSFGIVTVFCKCVPKQIVRYETVCLLKNVILWAINALFKWFTENEMWIMYYV